MIQLIFKLVSNGICILNISIPCCDICTREALNSLCFGFGLALVGFLGGSLLSHFEELRVLVELDHLLDNLVLATV